MSHRSFYIFLVIFLVLSLAGCAKTYSVNVNYDDEAGVVEGIREYEEGKDVTLVAKPNEGYNFIGWYENEEKIAFEEELGFIADKDRDLTATFEAKQYEVKVELDNSEAGSVSGSGTYEHGEEVLIEVKTNNDYKFVPGIELEEYTIIDGNEIRFKVYSNINLKIPTKGTTSEQAWNSVLYDAFRVFRNSYSFNNSDEIDPRGFVQFAFIKIVRDQGYIKLKEDSSSPDTYLITIDQLESIASKYFDMDDLNIENIKDELDDTYIEKEDAFRVHYNVPEIEKRIGGIDYEGLKKHGDNTYSAKFIRYYEKNEKSIQTEWNYELEKTNSNWVIKSLDKRHPDNDFVEIEGNIKLIEKIKNYPEFDNHEEMEILAKKNSKIIVSINGTRGYDYKRILGVIDTENMTFTKYIDLGEKVFGFKILEESIFVKTAEKLVIYSFDLKLMKSIDLPRTIKEIINRENGYVEEDGKRIGLNKAFNGYDINSNLTEICFIDEEGLKLYSFKTNEIDLLVKSEYRIKDGNLDLESLKMYSNPRFVANDSKILYERNIYETFPDYYIYESNKSTFIKPLEYGANLEVITKDKIITLNGEELEVIDLFTLKNKNEEIKQEAGAYPEFDEEVFKNKADIYAYKGRTSNNKIPIYMINTQVSVVYGPLANVIDKSNEGLSMMEVNVVGLLHDGSILCSYSYYRSDEKYFLVNPNR